MSKVRCEWEGTEDSTLAVGTYGLADGRWVVEFYAQCGGRAQEATLVLRVPSQAAAHALLAGMDRGVRPSEAT